MCMSQPFLIVISGFPATGKTTLAKKLSSRFKVPAFCADEFKEFLFDRIGNWENKGLFNAVSVSSYDLVYHLADLLLASGNSCIVEAFFRADLARKKLLRLRDDFKSRVLQIHMYSGAHIIEDRLRKRRETHERHPCHPDNFTQKLGDGSLQEKDELIRLENEKMYIGDEVILVETSDFNAVDFPSIFQRVENFLSQDVSE